MFFDSSDPTLLAVDFVVVVGVFGQEESVGIRLQLDRGEPLKGSTRVRLGLRRPDTSILQKEEIHRKRVADTVHALERLGGGGGLPTKTTTDHHVEGMLLVATPTMTSTTGTGTHLAVVVTE